MRILKSKALWGVICIVLAVLIGFVGVPMMQRTALTNVVTVVRTTTDIGAGVQITADMLETANVTSNVVGDNAVTDVNAAIGRYTISEMYKGDYVTTAKISDADNTENAFAAATARGQRIVSVTVPSLAADVSGRLEPGDIVSVVAYVETSTIEEYLRAAGVASEESNEVIDDVLDTMIELEPETVLDYEKRTFIPDILKRMEVAFVATDNAADADVEAHPEAEEMNTLPATVSFYASEDQALALAELENMATIHLVFVSRGADDGN